jgi:putative flippase GtrA
MSGWRAASTSGWVSGWQGQALRFAIVGVATAGLDFGVLKGLIALGVSPYLARPVSMTAALVATWLLNRRLTFRTAAAPSWSEFARYAATAVMGMAINYVLYSGALLLGLPVWLAFVIGTGVAAVFNFVRYRAILTPPSI